MVTKAICFRYSGLRACPNVNALGVKFWHKLPMQLCAYPATIIRDG